MANTPAPDPVPVVPDALVQRLVKRLYERLPLTARRRGPPPPPLPEAETAAADGLVAVGGRLTPELILEAYAGGIFPMAEPDGLLGWWAPNPRAIIELDTFHVPSRLRRRMKHFELRIDADWEGVLTGCARPEGTWISDEIRREYGELFRRGQCHTVEAWHEGKLAGGLYGVRVGAAFMAESKFHYVTDASKVALVGLVERMQERGFELLDVQYVTSHLKSMGASWISRAEYQKRLKKAVAKGDTPFK